MRLSTFVLAALLALVSLPALANAPAPWWPCEDKAEGDACGDGTYYDGFCGLQDGCTDEPSTDVNECLICDGSFSPGPDAGFPDVGGEDTAAADDAAGPVDDAQGDTGGGTVDGGGDDDGCSAAHATTSLGLAMLVLMGAWAIRRRRDA